MTDPLGPLPPEISRALAALPPPPPPPPVETLLARIGTIRNTTWTYRRVAIVAAACAVAAFIVPQIVSRVRNLANGDRPQGPAIAVVRIEPDGTTSPLFVQVDGEMRPLKLHAGSVMAGPNPRRYRVADRVDVEQAGGTLVAVNAADRFTVESGTATFRVPHREGAPVRVRARDVEVVDVGTTFTVEVGARPEVGGAAAPTLVTVAEGAVEANGVRVEAGFGLGFTGKTGGGAPWRLDAKPRIALERSDVPARAGAPVELRLVLSNPTDRWMTLPAPDPLGAPLFVEIAQDESGGRAGTATPVRITPSMWVDFDRLKAGIPPRGRTVVGVRFDTTFASKGTYRLRAVVQPAGTTDQPRSEELVLEIR